MVKLAQHIEWSSPIPSKTGEGVSSAERKKSDRFVAHGKPRKTLAELFESRATSSSSPSSSLLLPVPPLLSKTTTPPPPPSSVRTASSLSAASSSSSTTVSSTATTTPPAIALSSSSPPSLVTPLTPPAQAPASSSTTTPTPSAAHGHVTFDDKCSEKYRRHAHTPAGHRKSELAEGIKRSSSARKIADSSRHEGTLLRANDPAKRLSKSGPLGQSQPLPRIPLTNASNSEPSYGISPVKPSTQQTNGKPNENLPRTSIFGQEKKFPSTAATILSSLEQRNRSPFSKFQVHEHNQGNFLQKSIDTVESLQHLSRLREKETDRSAERRLDARHGTPSKEKKVRKGLFGLLTDSGAAKHLVQESNGTEASTWKAPGNLGRAVNTHQRAGSKVRDSKSSPTRAPSNVTTKTKPMDVEMQNVQHPGSRLSGHLGMPAECTEATSLTVEIPDKMVGLAWVGAEPRLLLPGNYTFPSNEFMLEQVVSEKSSYVKHGILHRVHIPEGHLGVAWVDGKATLLEAGISTYTCPSDRFSYVTTDDKMLSEKEFVLGPFRVVTVDKSEVGIKFCNRQPQILYSGRHCLSISKVEVFAGFESLLRRQSYVSEATAMSGDNLRVSADVWVEWQIKAEDAAAARLANITDVESAVCSKVRRSFNLVIWEINAHEMKLQLTGGATGNAGADRHPLLKAVSSNVHRECQDLFEEGWTVTIWDLQLQQIVIEPETKDVHGND